MAFCTLLEGLAVSGGYVKGWLQYRGMFVNILAYADDIVLLAPSWRGLQYLLNIVVQGNKAIDMSLNARKSVCMLFSPRDRSKVVMTTFPSLCADTTLQFVPIVLGIWGT